MICRLCVSKSKDIMNIFHSNDMQFNIAETITKYFGFEPTENDPVTSSICVPCWTRIEDFHIYYLSIEDAQRKFVKMYLQIDIKQEGPIDEVEEIKNELNAVEFLPAWCPRVSEMEKTTKILLKEEFEHQYVFDNDDWIHCESNSELPQNEHIKTKDRLKNSVPSSKETQMDTKATRKTRSKSKIKEEKPPPTKQGRKETKFVKNNEESAKKFAEVKLNRVSPHAKSKEYDQEIAERTKLKCDICAAEFIKFAEMQRHYRSAHNMPGYMVCCDKRFYKRHLFLNHLLTHVDPDRLKCNVCKRSYTNPRSLQYHMLKYHEADNPFQCDQCPKRYPKQFMLNIHKKRHKMKSIKENRCADCGKNFSTSYALQRHIRYMHSPKRPHKNCSFCDKVFKNPRSLKEHITTHTGETLYTCPHCPKTFNSNASMHSHRKKKHPKEWEEARKIRNQSVVYRSNNDEIYLMAAAAVAAGIVDDYANPVKNDIS